MSKTKKKEKGLASRATKRARKTANYLRFGPKANHTGRRQKRSRFGSFRPGKPTDTDKSPTPSGPVSKRSNRKPSSAKKHVAKHPLRPLRKRRHIVTTMKEQ